jgi:hypothetical protein
MANIDEIVGTTTDWENFNRACTQRWEEISEHYWHCKLHNTYFDPAGHEEYKYQDAEPCWACYDEFQIRL